MGRLTNEQFIRRAVKTIGNSYDFSKAHYVNRHTKVCIICPKHGVFWKSPIDIYRGKGCPRCGHALSGRHKMTQDEFIVKCKEKFGDKFGYSHVVYKGSSAKVKIVCPKHGVFEIVATRFLRSKHGCPKCGDEYGKCFAAKRHQESLKRRAKKDKRRRASPAPPIKDTADFIKRAREIHGDLYSYDKSVFKSSSEKLIVTCPKHGDFLVSPNHHLAKTRPTGCPLCAMSLLEQKMYVALSKRGIKFQREKRFAWLGRQRLDFYIPSLRMAVECQGVQHYQPVEHFGGTEFFHYIRERDKRKRALCEEHRIKLYYYDNKGWLNSDGERMFCSPIPSTDSHKSA